jgi:small conductance mechanosensitive channel
MANFMLGLTQVKDYLSTKTSEYLPKVVMVVVILVVGFFVIKILRKAIAKFFDKVDFDRAFETFIENVAGFVLWAILLIILLANLGVDVTGLVAGLGIMGFIIGFALQDTLGNLASGMFILFHKPFKVGDWVNIAGIVGEVRTVGVAACILKSPDGVKITIPNKKIWGDTIQNYTGNPIRKIFNLEVGISYSDDIGKAIKIIKEVLKKDPRVLKDPEPQVVAKEFGDSSINIAVRHAVKKDDYWDVYFDSIKAIKEAFDEEGITIPFPQRDLWIKEMKKGK